MQLKNLIRALEKAGLKVEINKNHTTQYICKSNTHICSFYKNGGDSKEAVCVNVRRHGDEHDIMSDYSAGFYADTIKSVIQVMTGKV